MQIQPRLIRLRDAPAYLGMDRNRFNREVRPTLTELRIGRQGVAFDRLEMDAWVDHYMRCNGRPTSTLRGESLWDASEARGSGIAAGSGISKNARSTPPVAGSAKAQEYLAALRQSKS